MPYRERGKLSDLGMAQNLWDIEYLQPHLVEFVHITFALNFYDPESSTPYTKLSMLSPCPSNLPRFLYFAAVELLTFGTFMGDPHDQHHPPPPEAEPHRPEVAKALDDAFKRYTLQGADVK